MSGTSGNEKDGWNVMFMGDEQVRSDLLHSVNASTDEIIAADITEGSRGRLESTWILNIVDDIIYVEVTGSLSKWETHMFSVDIWSPGIKKVILHLKDAVNTVLPLEWQCTLEEEALEQKAYEGTIRIQDMFTRVTDASARLDAVCNKLALLGDLKNSLRSELNRTEDVNVKANPTLEDTVALQLYHAKRKALINVSSSPILKHMKLEDS
ncbi:hypothetical protein EDD16DRAFT_1528253 [Pisolithus croceorrhizus]|nr:hypothetical protein EDD16DRAFT_1528253 [Pisolithus croceorrhizus]KAI6167581.1 hypothetical protein EDD17DRAFT_1503859 [Pisolithus thermaeus]